MRTACQKSEFIVFAYIREANDERVIVITRLLYLKSAKITASRSVCHNTRAQPDPHSIVTSQKVGFFSSHPPFSSHIQSRPLGFRVEVT